MPAVLQGLLVSFATLYAYRFRFPLKQSTKLVQSLQWLMVMSIVCVGYTRVGEVYLVLVLSPNLADRERPQQLPLKLFVGGLSPTLSFTARCRQSVRRLLVTNLPQLDQLI